MGPGTVGVLGTGIAPLRPTHLPTTPGTPPLPAPHPGTTVAPAVVSEAAVGLISVDQLTLSAEISGFRGITEGYNVVIAGNPNDHKLFPGTK